MVRIGSGALLALALAGCAPRPESTPMVNDPVPGGGLRQADARTLLVEAGARIKAEEQTAETGWLITAEVPDGLPVTWKGMQCKGDGPDRACTEYEIAVALKTASPQAARALAASRDVLFPADGVLGDDYVVWRMGFTYGGVTRAYLKNTLAVTIDMGFAAAKEVEGGNECVSPLLAMLQVAVGSGLLSRSKGGAGFSLARFGFRVAQVFDL